MCVVWCASEELPLRVGATASWPCRSPSALLSAQSLQPVVSLGHVLTRERCCLAQGSRPPGKRVSGCWGAQVAPCAEQLVRCRFCWATHPAEVRTHVCASVWGSFLHPRLH